MQSTSEIAAPSSSFKETHTVRGLGGYPYARSVEPAGREFFRCCKNLSRGRTLSHDSSSGDDGAAAVRAAEAAILKKYRKSIRKKDFLKLTMYQQLGLAEIGFAANNEQIKKSYHRVLIEHHPDKTGKTENDPNYLALQKAFNTLMDKKKRRAYDSMCDFDESIPSGTEVVLQHAHTDVGGDGENNGGVDFYALYGPVFARNARFSCDSPVPEFGDDSTDLETVYGFYDFWYKFDSWRDFTHDAEHDVDSAEHRDQKRFLAKKNEVVAKKKKKAEYARLTSLVERAMAADPRLRRAKFAEKSIKLAAKAAREAEANAKVEALKKIEESKAQEQLANKEASKNAKFEREMAKKVLRKTKKRFRTLLTTCRDNGVEGALDLEQADALCEALAVQDMTALCDQLDKDSSDFEAVRAKFAQL